MPNIDVLVLPRDPKLACAALNKQHVIRGHEHVVVVRVGCVRVRVRTAGGCAVGWVGEPEPELAWRREPQVDRVPIKKKAAMNETGSHFFIPDRRRVFRPAPNGTGRKTYPKSRCSAPV